MGATLCLCAGAVSSVSAQHFSFTDVSAEAGVDVMHASGESPYLVFMTGGGAVADFDRDGWADIFVLGGGGVPDKLFINNRDGTFTDRAPEWGVDLTQHSFGASAADYNGDGWVDLFVTSYGPGDASPSPMQHKLYRNNGPNAEGQCTFSNTAADAGVQMLLHEGFINGTGSGWGDIDLDGDLDLTVCAYNHNRAGNRVYINNNDGTFTDSTEALGLEFNQVQGFLPGWVDFNNDRYPEYMLIGDTGSSRYYVNHGPGAGGLPTFTEIEEVGDAFNNAMGLAVGDVNNDGLLDMYVSGSYYPFLDGPGNQLMVQRPDGSFYDAATEPGVKNGGWAWGVLIEDYDHDGLNDVLSTNGFNSLWVGEQTYLWKNMGDLVFEEDALASGLHHTYQGRGAVSLDYDNDGDLDIAIFASAGPFRLYRNDAIGPDGQTPAHANWLRVDLDTEARESLAPLGIGSLVTITTAQGQFIDSVDNSVSHCATGQTLAHFGLGETQVIDAVRVRWNDGSFTTLVDVPANQILRIEAPVSPADVDASGEVDVDDVIAFLGYFGDNSLAVDQDGNGIIGFSDVLSFIEWFLLDS